MTIGTRGPAKSKPRLRKVFSVGLVLRPLTLHLAPVDLYRLIEFMVGVNDDHPDERTQDSMFIQELCAWSHNDTNSATIADGTEDFGATSTEEHRCVAEPVRREDQSECTMKASVLKCHGVFNNVQLLTTVDLFSLLSVSTAPF